MTAANSGQTAPVTGAGGVSAAVAMLGNDYLTNQVVSLDGSLRPR